MGLGQVIIFFQESKYLLLITIIQALVIFVLAIILIPIYGAPAGVFSLWFGTLIYMLMYFYKKRQLFKEYFVEKIMVPYVLLYHLIVLFTFFNSLNISYILMVILFCAMIVRFYKSNKILLKEIWINKKAVHSL
jgi:membrane associated rhomboid family serine protease